MKPSHSKRAELARLRWLPWLSVLLLAGCGGSDAVKPAKLTEIKPVTATAHIDWRASVGKSDVYVFTPAIYKDAVYAAGHKGDMARFDATTGKQQWRIDTGQRLSGGVGADADLVLVATEKGAVLAYNLDGKPQWQSQASSEVLGAPRAADGVVVVRSGDGRIHGLDAKDGNRRWEYQETLPPLLLRAHPSVVIVRGIVLAGLAGGKLVALNLATGTPLWEAAVAQPRGDNELERVTDVAAAPVLEEGQACAVAYQGRIACFDLEKGTLLWSRDASSAAALAADPLTLYMTDDKGTVLAYDRTSGATVWKQDKLFARKVSGPVVAGTHTLVGDYEGYVHVLDREDGAFATRIRTDGSAISARPLRMGPRVLVQTRGGGLYALSVAVK